MDRIKNKARLIVYYIFLWVLLAIALYLSYGVYFVDTTSTKSKWIGLFAGAIAILFASYKILEISFSATKNQTLEKVSRYFANGTLIFLKRLFNICSFVFLLLIVPYLLINIESVTLKPLAVNFSDKMALTVPFIVCFLTGGMAAFLAIICSALMTSKTATRSSQFYAETNSVALKQLFNSGVVVACLNVAFVIIPLVVLFHIFKDYQVINGFVLGSAIVAIINNVSSSITRQAVDGANDVVVSFIAEIEKKDRRNPLLLLNGVSKSVLGVNVLSSDLFVSFGAIIISAMTIGGAFMQLMGMFLPIIVAGSGIFASVIVLLFTNIEKSTNPIKTLFTSMFCSNIILILISAFLIYKWLPGYMGLLSSVVIGAIGGYLICFAHSNLVFNKYKPILNVANSAISGVSPTIRQAVKEGFSAVLAPGAIFAISIILAFVMPGGIEDPSLGLFGIALSILTSISGIGVMLSVNTFGLTTSSVDTVLESYEEDIYDNRYPQNTVFNSIGQHIVSLGKNYINAMTILSSLSMLITFVILINLEQVDVINPYVMGSILMGATMPFLYSTCVMGIVSKTAKRLVLEVKKQIKKAPQILRYEMRPDYESCVEISAINSSVQVLINTCLIIAIGAIIAVKLKEEALCGFVLGAIVSAFGLIFMTSGTSLVAKSAKKYFEGQLNYLKNIEEYNALNINEVIFSSLKDIIVPSLNILVKFLAILLVAFAPFFVN